LVIREEASAAGIDDVLRIPIIDDRETEPRRAAAMGMVTFKPSRSGL
jgi:hypothetical protein